MLGGGDGVDPSGRQGGLGQSAEIFAAARRRFRLSWRRRRRAAVSWQPGLHLVRAGAVRAPLQGDDSPPDDGDGRSRHHPRRRRSSGRGDPQSEGPHQAESDRRLHDGAGRDARRGFRRRIGCDQIATRRRSRGNRDCARPDARFRRRNRGGLEQSGQGDDRDDCAARAGAAAQREARQPAAGRASERRRRRALARDGRSVRPGAGDPAGHRRFARRNGAGKLGSHHLWRNRNRRHPYARRGAPDDRDRRAYARACRAAARNDRSRIRAVSPAQRSEGGRSPGAAARRTLGPAGPGVDPPAARAVAGRAARRPLPLLGQADRHRRRARSSLCVGDLLHRLGRRDSRRGDDDRGFENPRAHPLRHGQGRRPRRLRGARRGRRPARHPQSWPTGRRTPRRSAAARRLPGLRPLGQSAQTARRLSRRPRPHLRSRQHLRERAL